MTISHAIATAVNTVKKWCAGGKGKTTAATKAKACAAVAQWEAKKAKSKVSEAWAAQLEESVRADGAWFWPTLEEAEEIIAGAERMRSSDHPPLEEGLGGAVWNKLLHPRAAKGRRGGGQFAEKAAPLPSNPELAEPGSDPDMDYRKGRLGRKGKWVPKGRKTPPIAGTGMPSASRAAKTERTRATPSSGSQEGHWTIAEDRSRTFKNADAVKRYIDGPTGRATRGQADSRACRWPTSAGGSRTSGRSRRAA